MFRTWMISIGFALATNSLVLAQVTTRASVDSGGTESNGQSQRSRISADGFTLAFESTASNLVAVDTNAKTDVFVHDLVHSVTTRVSVASNGTQGDGVSEHPFISADGRYVVFESDATNLVPGDTNGKHDVFVHDLQTGVTVRASVNSAGVQGNDASKNAALSADGRYVAFMSYASNLVTGDTNFAPDVFVRDMVGGTTVRVSVDSAGVQGNGNSQDYTPTPPAISADGRYVAFESLATNLVTGDTNNRVDIFVHDLIGGGTVRASVDSAGVQGNASGHSIDPSISGDGRYVAFSSGASNLVAGDGNGQADVFMHDLQSGSTQRVSVSSTGSEGTGGAASSPSITPDGRSIAFASNANNLVAGDTNGVADVFVHDFLSGRTVRVSIGVTGAEGNFGSAGPTLSADARIVAFHSGSTTFVLGDTNSAQDVFRRDRGEGAAFTGLCFGDGNGGACPCANSGGPGRGCENSAATGGASLSGSGDASFSADSVQLLTSGELPNSLSIVLQGSTIIAPVNFGDGLRCIGGALKRLYVQGANGGVISAPLAGDPSISAQSATLGDTIPLGATRIYQVYYRDSDLGFCPGGFNVTNAVAIAWGG